MELVLDILDTILTSTHTSHAHAIPQKQTFLLFSLSQSFDSITVIHIPSLPQSNYDAATSA